MGRRSGVVSVMNAVAREAARQAKHAEAERKRLEREAIKRARDLERAKVLAAKEAKIRYLEERLAEVDDLNGDINNYLKDLGEILEQTLQINDTISFNSLRITDSYPDFTPPKELIKPGRHPQQEDYSVAEPGFLQKLFPNVMKKYEFALQEAQQKYQDAIKKFETQESDRKARLASVSEQYEKDKLAFQLKVQQRNQEVDELQSAYISGDPDAVITYNTMVLERSSYLEDFPQQFQIAYVPESKELVIEYELPTKDIVPQVAEYKYVKTKDEVSEKARKASEVKEIYQDVIAATTLRSIHEIFEADQGNVVQVIVFNGFVKTVDLATGKDIQPHLISVRVTKEMFLQLDLKRVNKIVCLRNLGAQVSPRPTELQPIKPIIEFNMVDKRFVNQDDVLGTLDFRPNLMDLNPFEFENLVSNLFAKMGLDTKLTRSSRDGGVDAVAFDLRPIVGGKVVIQAKRYKNPVGVSAVRDLYGTMMNEGANKGILVTTSGYGPDAYEFSKDKPIELIDGSGLLYLLEQNGIKARIILPQET